MCLCSRASGDRSRRNTVGSVSAKPCLCFCVCARASACEIVCVFSWQPPCMLRFQTNCPSYAFFFFSRPRNKLLGNTASSAEEATCRLSLTNVNVSRLVKEEPPHPNPPIHSWTKTLPYRECRWQQTQFRRERWWRLGRGIISTCTHDRTGGKKVN